MPSPACSLCLIASKNLFQMFVFKNFVSKGMDSSDDLLLIECFLHLPLFPVQDTNPTDYQWMFTKQNQIDKLVKQKRKFPHRYFNKIFDDKQSICYVEPGEDCGTQRKFALRDSMIRPTLHWFHTMLGYCGSQCMHGTLQAQYHHPHLACILNDLQVTNVSMLNQMVLAMAYFQIIFCWCSLGGSCI